MDILLLALLMFMDVTIGIKCPTKQLTASDRDEVLNFHNLHRSNLAKGLEKAKYGEHAPSAREMYKLTYDCNLEAQAQSNAEKCKLYQDSKKSGSYGENLFATKKIDGPGDLLILAATTWWKEINRFAVWDSENRFTPRVDDEHVGNFTQMAWHLTTRIGCGVARCHDGRKRHSSKSGIFNIVCLYRERGNVIYKPIYVPGKPCSSKHHCKLIPGSICDRKKGLCLDPAAQGKYKPAECIEEWSEWSAWECTDTCGGCGVLARNRTCLSAPKCHCKGNEIQKDLTPCNFGPCMPPRAACCEGFKLALVKVQSTCVSLNPEGFQTQRHEEFFESEMF